MNYRPGLETEEVSFIAVCVLGNLAATSLKSVRTFIAHIRVNKYLTFMTRVGVPFYFAK